MDIGQSPSPPLLPAKMEAGRGSYTEHTKHPSSTLPLPDGGWDQGKAGTGAIEVKMAAWGGAGPKRPLSLAWGQRGLVGRWIHLSMKFGK